MKTHERPMKQLRKKKPEEIVEGIVEGDESLELSREKSLKGF